MNKNILVNKTQWWKHDLKIIAVCTGKIFRALSKLDKRRTEKFNTSINDLYTILVVVCKHERCLGITLALRSKGLGITQGKAMK